MLEINDIHVAYGRVQVLFGVSMTVQPGEIHCLLGRNGAGKTTTLNAVMGLARLTAGSARMQETELHSLPAHEIPKRRIGLVPQGRRLFAELTVEENLEIGLMARGSGMQARQRALDLFPRLEERMSQPAATLSGGEQQMLAVARALCLEPELLLLDEPTEGLQPSMISQIRTVICQMRDAGVGILLVEQRVDAVLSIADRVSFIEHGRVLETLPAVQLADDRSKLTRYLGV